MKRYDVTAGRNTQTQHWRGLLRGYDVTTTTRMYVQACADAHTHGCVHVQAQRV